MVNQFNFPTTIRFGNGAIKEIPKSLGKAKRPLIVTDRTIVNLPFIKEIESALINAGFKVSIFSDLGGNPIESDVVKGLTAYHEHQSDAMIFIGGGATLDVGKAIALMVNHPGTLFDYEDGKPDGLPTDQPFPYMIAIPTTAGTGSEVGRASVISDNDTKAKKIIFAPKMLPDLVIADPELTVGLPASVTAATGVDALTHLLEAYLAKGFHPMCDGIALEGIRLVAASLVKAVKDPENLEARGNMLAASMMGAVAFQKGLGVTHSCAHALSTVFDTHHGLANALMLPACMEFNRTAVPDKFEILAQTIGVETGRDFVSWTSQLNQDIGIKEGLKNIGVCVSDRLLDVAEADGCHPLGPRDVSRDDFKQIFESSL